MSCPILSFSSGQRSVSLIFLPGDLYLMRGIVFCLSLSRYLLLRMRSVLILFSLFLFIDNYPITAKQVISACNHQKQNIYLDKGTRFLGLSLATLVASDSQLIVHNILLSRNMKGEIQNAEKKGFKREDGVPHTPIHKSSTKKIRDPLRSPKKYPPHSKEKLSNSEINVSTYRKGTEQREKGEIVDKDLLEKKESHELQYKKDKRCIEPTEKIVERINNNLQLLHTRIQQLFQEQIDEDGGLYTGGQGKLADQGELKSFSSLVFKKNGSTLSLTKNSSKKRLEGRLTHDGIRSDRKYKEIGKASTIRVEAGWK